jgi:hypothetical protein
MKAGRPPKLTYPALRQIDSWMERKAGCRRLRRVAVRLICRRLGVSADTVYDAANRRGAYRDCARG